MVSPDTIYQSSNAQELRSSRNFHSNHHFVGFLIVMAIQYRVQHRAQVGLPRAARHLALRQRGLDQPPPGIAQITCIALPRPTILETGDFGPHVVPHCLPDTTSILQHIEITQFISGQPLSGPSIRSPCRQTSGSVAGRAADVPPRIRTGQSGQAALRSSSSIWTFCGPRKKAMRTPGRMVFGSTVNSAPFCFSSVTTASMPSTRSPICSSPR